MPPAPNRKRKPVGFARRRSAPAASANDLEARLNATLLILALGNFAIGTGAFVLAGILDPIAQGVGVSVAAAGQLMTAYALAYALGSPLLIGATSHLDRKRLMLAGLLVLAGGSFICAGSANIGMLTLGRVLMALGAGVFTPTAAVVAVTTTDPGRRGRALAIVFLGLSLAQVVGVPLGTYIGFEFGWRTAFILVAVLALIAGAGVSYGVPANLPLQRTDFKAWLRVLAHWRLVLALAVTVFNLAGQFAVYTYIGPVISFYTSLGAAGITALLWSFGVPGVLGNLAGGYASDRFGATRTLAAALGALALILMLLPLMKVSIPIAVALLMLWGFVGFAFMTPQQSRLISLAPDSQNIVLSLNASSIYMGTALGAAVGGAVAEHAGLNRLGLAGGVLVVVALLALALSRGETKSSLIPAR